MCGSPTSGRCAGDAKNAATAGGQLLSHVTSSRRKTAGSQALLPAEVPLTAAKVEAEERYRRQRGRRRSEDDDSEAGISRGIFSTCKNVGQTCWRLEVVRKREH
jgi:hypothetical protein